MSKALPRTSRLLVALTVGLGACGGGGKGSYPDASTFGTGGAGAPGGATGAAGASGGSAGSGGGIVFPGAGGSGTPAGGATGTATPPAAGSARLFSGAAILIGPGAACSSPPASVTPAPDRWCGAFVPNGSGNAGLVVFDVTKALAGTPITCGTTDTNCVPLAASVDATNSDATYGFTGQTLIYYDAAKVYAWRPGWTAGRAIMTHSASQAMQCSIAPGDVANVMCLSPTNNNLYAGSVASQEGGMLPLLETLTNGSTGINFSPDGLSAIWSVKSNSTGPAETLKMQTIGDATTKKTIATNVTTWSISPNGTRWYWLSAPATDSNMLTTGALQTAPYPAGTPATVVQTKVGQYVPSGANSAVTLTLSGASAMGADMNVVADVDAPATSTTTVEAMDVIAVVGVSPTGTILYATMAQQPDPSMNNVLVDLRTIDAGGTGKCVVAPTPVADPGASFNGTGTAVEWAQVMLDSSAKVTSVTGQLTTVADCAAHPFTTSLYSFYDLSTALLIEQNLDSTAITTDIVFTPIATTGVPGAPTLVQKAAHPTIEPLFPSPGRVLFALSSGASSDGIYASPVLATGTPYTAPLARPLAPLLGSRLALRHSGAAVTQAPFAATTRPAPSALLLHASRAPLRPLLPAHRSF